VEFQFDDSAAIALRIIKGGITNSDSGCCLLFAVMSVSRSWTR
jgi:hypothetical protein